MGEHFCPIHASARSSFPGECPVCGRVLVTDDARFPMLEHVLANPVHLAWIGVATLVLMAGAMIFAH